jgi:hypothetical protein
MLRGAFWLLATIVGVELMITVLGMGTCAWLLVEGQERLGGCSNLGQQIKEVWSEALAAILALLLAARDGKVPPDPPGPGTTDMERKPDDEEQ